MGLPVVTGANYPTADELRSQMLAEVRWMYSRRGLTVNVAEGSELYIRYTVIANRVCIALANNEIAVENASPLTAQGDDLIAIASRFGVIQRPASSAAGYVTIGVGGPAGTHVTIPTGFIATSPSGIQYETTSAPTVADGEPVEVQAKSGGAETDCAAGTVLTWDDASIGLLVQTCTVAASGISGGHDADGVEDVRRRLLRKLKMPAVGGNSASICEWAEESSSAVDVAFCYPAARGPSSYDVAIMSTDTSAVLSLTTINAAAANIQANMPGSENINTTSVTEQYVDVVIDASLPLPMSAGGAGGGWRDAAPWPSDADAAHRYAEILSLPTATSIRVNSTAADPPAAGKHIAIWNPTGGADLLGEMVEFLIKTVTPVGPPHYDLELDCTTSALTFVAAGMLVSAAATNLSQYARAFRDAMALLGPGEKSDNPDIIPRALRVPGPDVEFPSDITSLLLSSVSAQFAPIKDLSYADRYEHGTGQSGTGLFTARSSPSIPADPSLPPRILKLSALSFRRKV